MGLFGLYAVTADTGSPAFIADQIRAAISGGATAVQVRSKHADPQHRRAIAEAVLGACQERSIICIINDDVALADDLGADGVHLGRHDGQLNSAREQLGESAIIGVSCYNDWTIAQNNPDANYIAFGSVFASQTKPDAVRADHALFNRAGNENRNAVAIGGITAANAPEIVAAGADAIAVIGALFDTDDLNEVERSARELSRCFKPA